MESCVHKDLAKTGGVGALCNKIRTDLLILQVQSGDR